MNPLQFTIAVRDELLKIRHEGGTFNSGWHYLCGLFLVNLCERLIVRFATEEEKKL